MPDKTGTRTDAITATGWLGAPRAGSGIDLLADDWTWRHVPYERLAARTAAMAGLLHERGLAGERVAALTSSTEDFLVQFFALLAAGSTCVPIAPPEPEEDVAEYRTRTSAMLADSSPVAVLGDDGASDDFLGWPALSLAVPEEPQHVPPLRLEPPDPVTPALIQFSSGTTGTRKAVRISRPALDANFSAISRWLSSTPAERMASWLPLHHDMGLLGSARTIAGQEHLMLMSSRQFVERPDVWLRCFGQQGASLAVAPAFGYVHAARKVDPSTLAGCDFSGWRIAILGAEPIRADDLETFVTAFGGLGFRRRAFCPAYGLAEATLAVTGTPPDEEPAVLEHGPGSERPGAAGVRHPAAPGDRVVSSGRPLHGVRVSMRDAVGTEMGEGELGEIWVGGTSLADGYEPAGGDDFAGGWFRTGDAGVLQDGNLFVFGRLSDSFQVRGELVLAEQAENAIRRSVPSARSLVVLPSRSEGAGFTVVVESGRHWPPEDRAEARATIARLFGGTEVDLLVVGRGGVPRTSSGKPMRRLTWQRYLAGRSG
jgi:acyl-CoA synthetase (AMP-forming)/AMP-acid ligase II